MEACCESSRPTTCQLESGDLEKMILLSMEVWTADAEMTKGGVPGDEGRRDEEIAVQVLDVVRRRLTLVLVTLPPFASDWQERLANLLQIS